MTSHPKGRPEQAETNDAAERVRRVDYHWWRLQERLFEGVATDQNRRGAIARAMNQGRFPRLVQGEVFEGHGYALWALDGRVPKEVFDLALANMGTVALSMAASDVPTLHDSLTATVRFPNGGPLMTPLCIVPYELRPGWQAPIGLDLVEQRLARFALDARDK